MTATKKYIVIKGGKQDTGFGVDGKIILKLGEVWDIVLGKHTGSQFRKLNQRGGSTCILNGDLVARLALRDKRIREMQPDEPQYIAHDELRKRTGAR